MSSAWGEAWGASWGASWGAVGVVVPPVDEPAVGGGTFFRRVITGTAEIFLPALEAEAFGVHARTGIGTVSFAAVSVEAFGNAGAAGTGFAALSVGAGSGRISGSAFGEVRIRAQSLGRVSRSGAGSLSLEINVMAMGVHDPDEPAIIAMLLAA